jgi:hypothetical protein
MWKIFLVVIAVLVAFVLFKGGKKADVASPPTAVVAPAPDPIGAAAAERLHAPIDAEKSAVDIVNAPRNMDADAPSQSSTEGVTVVGAPK